MEHSIGNKILKKMRQNRRGKIFFTNDFVAFGDYKSCGKALERLTKQGEIMRVSRGIYVIPKTSVFFGKVAPPLDDIVRAIMKRDKAKIIPTGSYAKNVLGLSTQVPMKIVYLTNGRPRKLKIGNTTVILRETSTKNIATKGELSTLAIQALKTIRKDNVTDFHIEKIVSILKRENPKYLEHDIKYAPQWIQEILRKALTN